MKNKDGIIFIYSKYIGSGVIQFTVKKEVVLNMKAPFLIQKIKRLAENISLFQVTKIYPKYV